ncbi:hypothetical protein [Paractinoplanes brasiliensis]|uniref:Uncharacterized protein n=1 Tax=Paractinoplanes brasiliensis TaxID=52695 RepID=A0A4V3C671_9ACTN|nr:hypothetical protein [Actinoplanes brasiliensis]TDO32618.1 hypothetical protein C8E87_8087 [Actinoplanes brasiliensis]
MRWFRSLLMLVVQRPERVLAQAAVPQADRPEGNGGVDLAGQDGQANPE